MADMKISDLPPAPNVNDAQQFEVNDSGTSRRVTFQQVRTQIKDGLDAVYAAKNHNHDAAYAAKNHDHDATYSKTNHKHVAADITNASVIGKQILAAPDAAAIRAAIGAGTGHSNLQLGYTSTTAKPGNWKPHVANDTDGQLPWARLSGIPTSVTEGNLPQPLGVGSYVLARPKNGTIGAGATVAGSALRAGVLYQDYYANGDGDENSLLTVTPSPSISLTGSWRNMGGYALYSYSLSSYWALFLRIA